VAEEVAKVMAQLHAGHAPCNIEREKVDIKEEAGRRDRNGDPLPPVPESEVAATALAEEIACMANTPGGGALIVGVANGGELIGTELDPQWLRHRIYELVGGLTATVQVHHLHGVRILVITAPEAVEPFRYRGRVKWRVKDNCVEIDAASWHDRTRRRLGVDWSAHSSGHPLESANPVAVEVARRYLREAAKQGDAGARELAEAPTVDLLRRINVATSDDQLTNAGALLFVATPHDGIDYRRRDVAGGDSTKRLKSSKPLLEQLAEVEAAAEAANRLAHMPAGFAHGQVRELPPIAIREAIVNGAIHRDWMTPEATIVEHVNESITVTSPGGFLGGVGPSNIITHPSAPRYRSLAEAAAAIRLAEREGIGVDRMVREMLALGHAAPEITEIAGPYVHVSLIGGPPNAQVLQLLGALTPAKLAGDVDVLLLLHQIRLQGWIDVERAAPLLQRSARESAAALARLGDATTDDRPVIVAVHGVPADDATAYRFGDAVRKRIAAGGSAQAQTAARQAMLVGWAKARGRISSTEAADLAGVASPSANVILQKLEADGHIKPGRTTRTGRGFFYVPA
jgi:ATP-dependent DNA helicase RecG